MVELNKSVMDSKIFDLVLNENNESIVGYFLDAINSGLETNLFNLFDNHLADCLKSDNKTQTNIQLTRVLSLCSQFNKLSSKSAIKPNDSKSFNGENDIINGYVTEVVNYFENFEFESGLKCLKQLRHSLGIGNSNITHLYDCSVKTLIKNSVKTVFSSVFIKDNDCSKQIAINEWVCAKSPARIDLQGGWTDTPPICYELGGRVINIGVEVNNEKPIGAKARRVELSEQQLISIKEYDLNRRLLTDLRLNDIKELLDYCDPGSSGALIKSTLICCQLIDIKSDQSLCQQLQQTLNSGLELELWSNLPQGSGLGTSSILSGCVIAVLWTLLGKRFSKSSLINAVLYVEQLMSTGGGWQDQIGGLIGGVKLGRSLNSLPLKIDYKVIEISESFRKQLDSHLVLIYSGSVRLAKNLLENVIQNWYIRDQTITDCFNQLLTNTDLCFEAFLKEDIKTIGKLLTKYWEQKKILAPNSEPKHISEFLNRVQTLIFGGSLCGAGGGGFMVLIVKEPDFKNQIISLAERYLPESQVYNSMIDEKGLQLSINGIQTEIPLTGE